MIFEVAGIERIDYESRSTGRRVTGYRLHLHFSDSRIDGLGCKNVYVPDRLSPDCECLHVGDKIRVFYNEFKSVDCIQAA